MQELTTLDQYLTHYGSMLGAQAAERLEPLHRPTIERPHSEILTLKRKPYPSQAACITAAAKTLKRQSAVIMVGECGCLGGETEIFDPVENKYRRIDQIDEEFHVAGAAGLTNVSILRACRPFLKGEADLYRVSLSNGQSFVATLEHRILTCDGWKEIADVSSLLQKSVAVQLPSNWEPARQECPPDVQRSMRTQPGSTDGCSAYHHPCGEQPLSEGVACQSPPPQQGGEAERIQPCLHSDAQVVAQAGSRSYRRFDRRANSGYGVHSTDLDVEEERLPAEEPCGSSVSESRASVQSPAGSSPRSTTASFVQSASQRLDAACCFSPLVHQVSVVSVEFVRHDKFYDFTVPVYHNYMLAGIVHHNSGKTIMGMSALHCHANGNPYRVIVFCPGQLVKKWAREIMATIPRPHVKIISRCSDLLGLTEYGNPRVPEWYIIGRDTAKLGPGWRPAVNTRVRTIVSAQAGRRGSTTIEVQTLYCPSCGNVLEMEDKKKGRVFITIDALEKKRMKCECCGSALWQNIRKPDRFEPAKFIHKKLRGFFDYMIVDEVHQEKGAETAQGQALGSIAASCRKVIALTGTLIGGYAEHLRPLLFRLAPTSVIEAGFTWHEPMPFNETYGRIELRITEKSGGGDDNRQSRGSKTTKTKYCRPGIMPSLFGEHLMGSAVFLGLQEMEESLPILREFVVPVPMDSQLKLSYDHIEGILKATVRQMAARKDRRLLGAMLQTLMGYPDHPFGWGDVGYNGKEGFVPVVKPPNLGMDIRAKEKWLIETVQSEKMLGRQVWVYVQMNGVRDVESRLARMLELHGLNVKVLKQSVPLKDREEWIDKHCRDVDVVLSHPKLVETGLDLFSKAYLGHNFCTLIFFQTGYELPVMRQASRRAWRLTQPKECKVFYCYYEGTMQERAMALMGRKLLAAEALEGKFSSEGLVAMAGDDGIEMAMAKSLAENMDSSVDRTWVGSMEAVGKLAVARSDEPVVVE